MSARQTKDGLIQIFRKLIFYNHKAVFLQFWLEVMMIFKHLPVIQSVLLIPEDAGTYECRDAVSNASGAASTLRVAYVDALALGELYNPNSFV